MNTLSTKRIYIVGAVSLLLGILFDYFFYDKAPGISVVLYVAALLVGVYCFLHFFKASYDRVVVWFLPAIIFFSAMTAVRDSGFLRFVNSIIVIGLLLLFSHHLIGRRIRNILFLDYVKTAVLLPITMLGKSFNALGTMLSVGKGMTKGQKTSQITKGILITVPIVLFFVFLMQSADLVFQKLISNLFDFHVDPATVTQICLAIFFGWVWLGVYTYILENATDKEVAQSPSAAKSFKFGNIEAGILFSTLSVLFFTFVIIQIKYLFAGVAAVTELGYTYAEYAHKGFGELIGVAVLTFALIFLAERYIERNNNKPSAVFKITTGILMALVLVIMASAFMRLNIYEEAYGFTVLRILVQSFIVWLGAVFLWLGCKIVGGIEDYPFVFGIFLLVITFFVAINLLNPDAFVTKQNINQFVKTGKLDTTYLATLSADAVPDLIPLLQIPAADENGRRISGEVAAALKKYFDRGSGRPWQSYNYSRTRALQLIRSNLNFISNLAQTSTTTKK